MPIGVLGIVVSLLVIKESRDTSHEQSIDLPGLLTSGLALFALSYALIEGNSKGWASAEILGLFAAAAVFLAAFILLEKRQRLPMLDLSLFKIPSFVGANVVALLVSLGMFGVFFFVSLYVQNVLGLLADEGRRDLPADDDPDHPDRPDRREALRPDRRPLADGWRHGDHSASRCCSTSGSACTRPSGRSCPR